MADQIKLPIKILYIFFIQKISLFSFQTMHLHCLYEQVPLSWFLSAEPLKVNHCSVSMVKSLEFCSFLSLTLFATFLSYQKENSHKTYFYVNKHYYSPLAMDFYSSL